MKICTCSTFGEPYKKPLAFNAIHFVISFGTITQELEYYAPLLKEDIQT